MGFNGILMGVTLWQTYKKLLKIAIYSSFRPKKMVIFHSDVSLPEGNFWFELVL